MTREITAYSNPLIRRVRALRDKRHRREEGLFLAEGLRIVAEARDVGHLPQFLFFTRESSAHPLVVALIAEVEAGGGEAIETLPDIMSKLSGKDNPQSVVGVFAEFVSPIETIDRSRAPIWLVAERLRDPGNLGTILRTGDAIGAGALFLIGDCVDPFSSEAVRASMGALFTIPIVRSEWREFETWLRGGEGQLVGLSLDAAVDYRAASYRAPVFLLTGNEARGLPAPCVAACDLTVKIPMLGRADSLNAAVATAVVAYRVLDRVHAWC